MTRIRLQTQSHIRTCILGRISAPWSGSRTCAGGARRRMGALASALRDCFSTSPAKIPSRRWFHFLDIGGSVAAEKSGVDRVLLLEIDQTFAYRVGFGDIRPAQRCSRRYLRWLSSFSLVVMVLLYESVYYLRQRNPPLVFDKLMCLRP